MTSYHGTDASDMADFRAIKRKSTTLPPLQRSLRTTGNKIKTSYFYLIACLIKGKLSRADMRKRARVCPPRRFSSTLYLHSIDAVISRNLS